MKETFVSEANNAFRTIFYIYAEDLHGLAPLINYFKQVT